MAGIAVLDNMQKGLTALPGVKGIITVQNSTALPVRTTISSNLAAIISHHILKILPKARAVLAEVDPADSIQFVRVRGKNFEYLVVLDKEYTMISIQEHTAYVLDESGPAVTGAVKMQLGADDVNANLRRKSNNNNNSNSRNANNSSNNPAATAQMTVEVDANAHPRLSEAARRQRARSRRSADTAAIRKEGGRAVVAAGAAQTAAFRRMRGGGGGGVGGGKRNDDASDFDFMKANFGPSS